MKTPTATTKKAPPGFEYWPHLMATIDGAAETFGVTARTVRNWLNETDMPRVERKDEGLPALIPIAAAAYWLVVQQLKRQDFGKHGGRR